jgi:hypothetical protein
MPQAQARGFARPWICPRESLDFCLRRRPLPACGAGGRDEGSLIRKKVTRITADVALPLYSYLQDRGLRGG